MRIIDICRSDSCLWISPDDDSILDELRPLQDRDRGLLFMLREFLRSKPEVELVEKIDNAWAAISLNVECALICSINDETRKELKSVWANLDLQWPRLWRTVKFLLFPDHLKLSGDDKGAFAGFLDEPSNSASCALLADDPAMTCEFPIVGAFDGAPSSQDVVWVRLYFYNEGSFECQQHPLDTPANKGFKEETGRLWQMSIARHPQAAKPSSVVWEVIEQPKGALDGTSAGGAFVKAFNHLLEGQKVDPRILVSVSVGSDGALEPVDGIAKKTKAAVMSNAVWLKHQELNRKSNEEKSRRAPGIPCSEIDRIVLLPQVPRNHTKSNIHEAKEMLQTLRDPSNDDLIRRAAWMIDLYDLENGCSVPI